MEAAVLFAVAFATLFTAHSVGDHWVQTHHQACHKGVPGWGGRLACLRHVVSLQVTKLVVLLGVCVPLGLELSPGWVALALVVDGASHYVADRRTPLVRLAQALERVAGKASFAALGAPRPGRDDAPHLGTGFYALDQSYHHAWVLVAAVLVAMGGA